MKILVSDTSVLIDLERGDLLPAVFSLSFDLVVPDLLYRRELRGYGGEHLIELGLRVAALDESGLARALGLRRRRPALSLPDSLALTLAAENRWTLLTGDRALRELAVEIGVPCHGVLWVLDQIDEQHVLEFSALHSALRAIASHPRCRLPARAVRVRLERYERAGKR